MTKPPEEWVIGVGDCNLRRCLSDLVKDPAEGDLPVMECQRCGMCEEEGRPNSNLAGGLLSVVVRH